MKKQYIFIAALIGISISFAWQSSETSQIGRVVNHVKNTSGPPAGRTGAPGEGNCTACHSGTVQNGATQNILTLSQSGNPISGYLPGETYDVSITTAVMSAKQGFEVTALNGGNSAAGTFVAPSNTGTRAFSGNGRNYVSQNTAGSNSSSFPTWDFTWTAPATDAGPVTFYLATNSANGNGQDGGDVIYVSQHPISSTANVNEVSTNVADFNVGYSAASDQVFISYSSLIAGSAYLNLLDLSGKSVMTTDLGTANIGTNKDAFRLPSYIKNGLYIVHFFVNNNAVSKKIMVQR